MFTQLRIFRAKSTVAVRAGCLLLAASALVGCGGGGNSAGTGLELTPPAASATATAPPPAPAPAPAPKARGSVTVSAITTSGAPVSGVSVALNGGFNVPMSTTDSNGEVTFHGLPAGDGSAVLWGSGYHGAGRRLTVADGSVTKVTVTLEHVTEATPVVLATHPVASNDGMNLTVDVDIAVLDENGRARETLTAADFALLGGCDWAWCIVDANGTDTNRWYIARVDDATFHPMPTQARPTIAAAILLDQSDYMAEFDRAGTRLQAVNGFLESVTSPDTVALGSFQGIAGAPTLTNLRRVHV